MLFIAQVYLFSKTTAESLAPVFECINSSICGILSSNVVPSLEKGFLNSKMRLQGDSGASLFSDMDVWIGSKGESRGFTPLPLHLCRTWKMVAYRLQNAAKFKQLSQKDI
jgi:hypothetical protein